MDVIAKALAKNCATVPNGKLDFIFTANLTVSVPWAKLYYYLFDKSVPLPVSCSILYYKSNYIA